MLHLRKKKLNPKSNQKDEKEPGAETMAAVPVKDDKIPIESTIESDSKVKDTVPIPEEKVFAAKETVGEASLNDDIISQDEKELKQSPIKKVSQEDAKKSTNEKHEEEKITAKGAKELKDALSSKQEEVSAPTKTVDKESSKDENISADQKEEEKSAEDEAPLQDEKIAARGAMELKDTFSSEHKKLSAPVDTVDKASLKDDTTSVNEEEVQIDCIRILPNSYPKIYMNETKAETPTSVLIKNEYNDQISFNQPNETASRMKRKHNILIGYDFVDENDSDIQTWDLAIGPGGFACATRGGIAMHRWPLLLPSFSLSFFLAQAACVRHACLLAPCVAWPLLSPLFSLSLFLSFPSFAFNPLRAKDLFPPIFWHGHGTWTNP